MDDGSLLLLGAAHPLSLRPSSLNHVSSEICISGACFCHSDFLADGVNCNNVTDSSQSKYNIGANVCQ